MIYRKKYFDWQKDIGLIGGILNKFKFEKYIKKEDTVIDFGSGGGYLLKNINCKEKKGIEINPIARKNASNLGIKSVSSINKIKDNYANVIISNHALEHVKCPLDILKKLKLKLKKNGRIIFVVPHQGPKEKFKLNDINQHLYTWNPLTLGNLFKEAGFNIIEVKNIRYTWKPSFYKVYKVFNKKLFDGLCKIYSLYKNNYQIRIIAKR